MIIVDGACQCQTVCPLFAFWAKRTSSEPISSQTMWATTDTLIARYCPDEDCRTTCSSDNVYCTFRWMDHHHCFSEQAGASSVSPVTQIQCPLAGWHDSHRRTAFSESVTQQILRCRQACRPQDQQSRWEYDCGHTQSLKCWRIWRGNLQLLLGRRQRTTLQPIWCHPVMSR